MSHLDLVRKLPCVLCMLLGQGQTSKTDAHHIREGQGGAQRAQDELAIPLCHETCHQGPRGIHGDRSLLRLVRVDELDLLAITIRWLRGDVPRVTAPRIKPTREREARALSSSKVLKHSGVLSR